MLDSLSTTPMPLLSMSYIAECALLLWSQKVARKPKAKQMQPKQTLAEPTKELANITADMHFESPMHATC